MSPLGAWSRQTLSSPPSCRDSWTAAPILSASLKRGGQNACQSVSTLSSRHRPEATLGYENEELERRAARVLFPSLPLADQAGRHVEITGEDSLTGPFPYAERTDFPGLQRQHGRKAKLIEFAHGALVHDAGSVNSMSFALRPCSSNSRMVRLSMTLAA